MYTRQSTNDVELLLVLCPRVGDTPLSSWRRLGPSQSPVDRTVVAAVTTHIYQQTRAVAALKWGAVTSVAMVLVLADM